MAENMNCEQDCESCQLDCDKRVVDLQEKPHELSRIKKVIGVMSGKGGVGKSLVTAMLAVLLRRRGLNTAILDADVTGPSIPTAFGIKEKAAGDDYGIYPAVSKTGIGVISTNMLLQNETDPVVWRGPVIAGTVKQFYTDVIWGDVDIMLVDMPPGTGDVPLTVFQSLPVDGIVVVASPQQLVSMIVQKAVNMARLMNIPVLGLVENMSYFTCPDCGEKHEIFGASHIDEIASAEGIGLVSKIPIQPKLAAAVDAGTIELFSDDSLAELATALSQMV